MSANEKSKSTKPTGRKGGRPSKLTPELRVQFLNLLRVGNYRGPAAAALGLSYDCFRRFMLKRDRESEEFRVAVLQAESFAESTTVARLFKKAQSGDLRAIEVFLSRRYPERWSNNAELLREMNRLIRRLEERIERGVDVDSRRKSKRI